MLQDLDPNLISALEELRREFDEKLQRQREEFQQALGVSPAPVEDETAPPPPAAPEVIADLDPLEELKLAAAEIDHAESQADVLDALIRGAARFSSRTAVFLCRDGALHGWGGTGFGTAGESIKEMTLSPPAGSPWEQIAQSDGGLCLSSSECAPRTFVPLAGPSKKSSTLETVRL